MSKKPTKTAEARKPAAEPLRVRCKILKNGLACAGGVAAEGAVLVLELEAAKFHEGRGEAEILGTL